MEKIIKWLCFIYEDKWSFGEYRLWVIVLVNCRRCKYELFFIVYFYEVFMCMILGFCVINFFFFEKSKESGMKICILNIGLMRV